MGLAVSSAAFTMHQTDQAIVLQFGNPKRVTTEPSLHLNSFRRHSESIENYGTTTV